MRARWQHVSRDERGMSLVFVSVAFLALLTATTIAIDVGMFMTARSQAQNAADAGALAGATALAFNNFNDRTPSGPAVQSAVNTALANRVGDSAVSVTPSDVTFPNDPTTGQPNRVQVQVYRTAARSNAVPTLMGGYFGLQTVDVAAVATAEASPANAMTCVKPFTIPDRWIENVTPPWTVNSTFDRYYQNGPNHGQVMTPTADEYPPAGDPRYNGYNIATDVGLELTIRAGTGNNVSPSFYFSWAMPNNTGADDYSNNISGCNPTVVTFGQPMNPEPGDMTGPTNQGVDALLAQDPNAYWDTTCNCVRGSAFRYSPRIFPIPLYDPDYYQSNVTNGRNASLRVANWLGFFLEYRSGNNVTGRVTPLLGTVDPSAGPAPAGAFPRAIRLVQ
jgi:hypothetical protein